MMTKHQDNKGIWDMFGTLRNVYYTECLSATSLSKAIVLCLLLALN